MNDRTCYGNECENRATRKGLCGKHYDRMRKHGDPDYVAPKHVQRVCSVPGCEKPYNSNGLCMLHYGRLRINGTVGTAGLTKFTTTLPSGDVVGRIMERTQENGECIEWTGYVLPSGYGIIRWRDKTWVTHRAMWTAKRGEIPTDDDWTIDHLCRNRRCVNVKHMEVVTRTENALRAGGLAIANGRNKQRSAMACKNGHERTAENTIRDKHGNRSCVPCKKITSARANAKTNLKRRAIYAEARANGLTSAEAALKSQKVAGYELKEVG